ncbi:MAG: molybdate ABC transporter substrate-binding protein [Lachnospiraceae bacterium]|nr:molybdate ABC transporter substrate-binding protein [Lachnospiraceae bacterium]
MKKRVLSFILAAAMIFSLAACGKKAEETPSASEATSTEAPSTEAAASGEPAEIQVFIAASLNKVMTELAEMYNKDHPEVTINYNADSSGTLLTQIQEGAACDMFFSAAQKQMNALEEDKLIVEGTRVNVVNNQVCVVKAKGTETAVTGLADIEKAKSIALADGSVPVGKYTRQALVKIGKLPETEDVSTITTAEVMNALGGVEISEQSNVSKVRTAVMEGSCEVGTVYYSDTYTFEDQLEIIEKVSYDLTGNVIYPLCRVVNKEATDAQNAAADAFYQFLLSDEATAVFDKYLFDTNVER